MPTVLVALLLAIAADPPADTSVDTVVVCPSEFRAAMKPWIELRAGQGHHIGMLSNLGSPEEIRAQVLRLVPGGKLRFVLLVGGAEASMNKDAAVRARCVPMHYAPARINVKWGSTPTIPTDNWYVQADPASDENPLPSLAIGRLPAASPQELAGMIKKIVDYERSTDLGPWRQRVNFVAGVGNFGLLADTVLESAAEMLLTQSIPAEYHVSMTYGNWRSPFCPDPRRFHETAIERLDEGALYWVYMGHATPGETARMRVPGGKYPILTTRDAPAFRGGAGRPIAIFLSCSAGALDARGGCLASTLVAAPGGPVAVVAGTRVTMPYAMTVMATNLSNEFFRGNCRTLGEALLHAKQRMLQEPDTNDTRRAMLDSIAAAISPSGKELAGERAENVRMFNLIGDPLLDLRHPQPLEVRIAKTVAAGGSLQIDGFSPVDGLATVELVLRRDRLRGQRPARNVFPASDAELAAFDEVYRRANDPRVASRKVPVREGHFQSTFAIPPEALGSCHICVFVAGKTGVAMGSATIEVVQPEKSNRQLARTGNATTDAVSAEQ